MKSKMQTVSENLKWNLNAEREENDILMGIMHSLALLIKEKFPTDMPSYEEIWNFYRKAEGEHIRADRFAAFVKELHRVYSTYGNGKGITGNISVNTSPLPPSGIVSYVRNPASDKAFSAFSSGGALKASTASDFKSACEDVYYERSEYCLLPFESSYDGLLYAFRRLADKYELKISSIIKIASGNDELLTIGLFSSVMSLPLPESICELSVSAEAPWSITELGNALSGLDSSVKRINFMPSRREEGYDAHISIRCGSDPFLLNTFFSSAYPSFTYYGSYKSI